MGGDGGEGEWVPSLQATMAFDLGLMSSERGRNWTALGRFAAGSAIIDDDSNLTHVTQAYRNGVPATAQRPSNATKSLFRSRLLETLEPNKLCGSILEAFHLDSNRRTGNVRPMFSIRRPWRKQGP